MKNGATANKDETVIQVCSIRVQETDYSYLLTQNGQIVQVNNTLYNSQMGPQHVPKEASNEDPATIFFAGRKIKQMVQGRNHVLVLDSEGNVWGWGDNSSHQITFNLATGGDESNVNQEQTRNPILFHYDAEPVQTPGSSIFRIGAWRDSSFAVDKVGTIYMWGANHMSAEMHPEQDIPTEYTQYKKEINQCISQDMFKIPYPMIVDSVAKFKFDKNRNRIAFQPSDNLIETKENSDGSLNLLIQHIQEIESQKNLYAGELNKVENVLEEVKSELRQFNKKKQTVDKQIADLRQIIANYKNGTPESDSKKMSELTDNRKVWHDKVKVYEEKRELLSKELKEKQSKKNKKYEEYKAFMKFKTERKQFLQQASVEKNLNILRNRIYQIDGQMKKLVGQTLDNYQKEAKNNQKNMGYEDCLNEINGNISRIEMELQWDNELNTQSDVKDVVEMIQSFIDHTKQLVKRLNGYIVIEMMNAQGKFEMIRTQDLDNEQDPTLISDYDDERPQIRNLEMITQKINSFKN